MLDTSTIVKVVLGVVLIIVKFAGPHIYNYLKSIADPAAQPDTDLVPENLLEELAKEL